MLDQKKIDSLAQILYEDPRVRVSPGGWLGGSNDWTKADQLEKRACRDLARRLLLEAEADE